MWEDLKAGEGTGLGLATVLGIMQQNKGFIHALSRPGLGTTLKLYFPRLTEPTANPIKRQINQSFGDEKTILLVEDEDCVRADQRSPSRRIAAIHKPWSPPSLFALLRAKAGGVVEAAGVEPASAMESPKYLRVYSVIKSSPK